MSEESEPVTRGRRAETREMAELLQLKEEQPELAEAADLQIELLELQRRIRGRLGHPDIEIEPDRVAARVQAGRPVLAFEDVGLDWPEFRLLIRRATDLLLRFEAIEPPAADAIQSLAREGRALEPLARHWYEHPCATADAPDRSDAPELPVDADAIGQVLLVAMRPFLVRAAEAVIARHDLGAWTRGSCPVCGGDPELAVITRDARRMLVCSRCFDQWAFDPMACPYCGNADKARITSFASRDRLYRIAACDVCQRYLKAYDARQTDRPLRIAVDTIATLPLDAAAIRRGYRG
jgi:FdhE protein